MQYISAKIPQFSFWSYSSNRQFRCFSCSIRQVFVNFVKSIKSAVSPFCTGAVLLRRPQRPHGRKPCHSTAHGKPVPPRFQPPEVGCKREHKAAHALPQRQKPIVHPCVREAEQIGGKGRQHRRKAGVTEGQPGITGHHPPALRKGKPCRKPQRHCK